MHKGFRARKVPNSEIGSMAMKSKDFFEGRSFRLALLVWVFLQRGSGEKVISCTSRRLFIVFAFQAMFFEEIIEISPILSS
jgi:hypothetical protein